MASKVDFNLPENLTISKVQQLHEEMEVLLGKKDCDKVVLKANKVQRADTAGLQLLLAFVNATKEGHIDLNWSKPSDNLCEAARVLGLDTALGLAS